MQVGAVLWCTDMAPIVMRVPQGACIGVFASGCPQEHGAASGGGVCASAQLAADKRGAWAMRLAWSVVSQCCLRMVCRCLIARACPTRYSIMLRFFGVDADGALGRCAKRVCHDGQSLGHAKAADCDPLTTLCGFRGGVVAVSWQLTVTHRQPFCGFLGCASEFFQSLWVRQQDAQCSAARAMLATAIVSNDLPYAWLRWAALQSGVAMQHTCWKNQVGAGMASY